MPLVPMILFSPRAKKEGFAVGQFNMNNLEFAQAIIEAAKEERSPFIFGVSEGAIVHGAGICGGHWPERRPKKPGCPSPCIWITAAVLRWSMKCIRAGFSSVMFDGSHLSA